MAASTSGTDKIIMRGERVRFNNKMQKRCRAFQQLQNKRTPDDTLLIASRGTRSTLTRQPHNPELLGNWPPPSYAPSRARIVCITHAVMVIRRIGPTSDENFGRIPTSNESRERKSSSLFLKERGARCRSWPWECLLRWRTRIRSRCSLRFQELAPQTPPGRCRRWLQPVPSCLRLRQKWRR
jgi:hypothetical protein